MDVYRIVNILGEILEGVKQYDPDTQTDNYFIVANDVCPRLHKEKELYQCININTKWKGKPFMYCLSSSFDSI